MTQAFLATRVGTGCWSKSKKGSRVQHTKGPPKGHSVCTQVCAGLLFAKGLFTNHVFVEFIDIEVQRGSQSSFLAQMGSLLFP